MICSGSGEMRRSRPVGNQAEPENRARPRSPSSLSRASVTISGRFVIRASSYGSGEKPSLRAT